MLAKDKVLKEASPLSIFFIKSGSGGNKLLFRYPFDENFFQQQQHDELNFSDLLTYSTNTSDINETAETTTTKNNNNNNYSNRNDNKKINSNNNTDITSATLKGNNNNHTANQNRPQSANLYFSNKLYALGEQDRLQFRSVIQEKDDALCNMFSVNPNLCGQKFEIKINSVRHVGHPMSLLPSPIVSNSSGYSNCGISQINSNNQPSLRQAHIHQLNLSLSSYGCLTAPSRTTASTSSNLGNHTNLNNNNNNPIQGDITSFNIVCALRASASYDIVDCYHDLSKRLAIALSFEERRCSYLSREIRTILAALDERDMANLSNQDDDIPPLNKNNSSGNINPPTNTGAGSSQSANKAVQGMNQNQNFTPGALNNANPDNSNQSGGHYSDITGQVESVFSIILRKSNLAKDLKTVFMSLSTTGIVDLKINNWVSVSFCLPQKVHRLKSLTHKSMPAIGTKDIKRCLLFLRPYHGLLLLQEPQEILDSLPIDASPAFIQLIKVIKPDKNFMDLSVDANLTLMQIFCIVSQLIYWAKATVIYPICDSNIYAIHPLSSTGIQSKLVSDFQTRFPNSKSLHHYLADFSEGTSLSQINGPLLNIEEKLNLLSIVTWLLQRRILTQIHKYIFLVVDKTSDEVSKTDVAASKNQLSLRAAYNNNLSPNNNQSSPNGIEINLNGNGGSHMSSNGYHNNGYKYSNNYQASSIDSSPQGFKNSFSESFESSLRRYRADSLDESQEDSNFGLNSSLSSTPNSNLEYPSPSNDQTINNRLSSGCAMDNSLGIGQGITSSSIISTLQKAGFTQAGAKNVLAVPSSKNTEDLKLLIRLLPYFDGKHHVEDIMFFENLERSQVLILCDKFRDVLFTCHYEDVAVIQLSPLNK